MMTAGCGTGFNPDESIGVNLTGDIDCGLVPSGAIGVKLIDTSSARDATLGKLVKVSGATSDDPCSSAENLEAFNAACAKGTQELSKDLQALGGGKRIAQCFSGGEPQHNLTASNVCVPAACTDGSQNAAPVFNCGNNAITFCK